MVPLQLPDVMIIQCETELVAGQLHFSHFRFSDESQLTGVIIGGNGDGRDTTCNQGETKQLSLRHAEQQ